MGDIEKILCERNTGGGFYEDKVRIELEECIHLHYRDLRLTLNGNDFLTMCDIFEEAKKKYNKMGRPETAPAMTNLAETRPLTKGIASNRLGIEFQGDGTIHVHYKDLRTHLSQADFLYHADVYEMSAVNFPDKCIKKVKISDCIYHPVVDKYVKELDKFTSAPTRDLNEIKSDMIKTNWGSNFKYRNLGFPTDVPKPIPEELDKEYLGAMYLSIHKNGYGTGAFKNKYIVAYEYPDGKIYLTASHRLACLIYLGYNTIKVILVKPESGWRT